LPRISAGENPPTELQLSAFVGDDGSIWSETALAAPVWQNRLHPAWSPQMDFDFDGQFFKSKGVRAKPKPYGGTRPLIMNAGASATGQAFTITGMLSSTMPIGRQSTKF
jgi:alkanesulfonate monooxygenase SsuD/methylene tetrahydromethanopterin reductase-like flavin-dependent oxidoreductase (luciferase family)